MLLLLVGSVAFAAEFADQKIAFKTVRYDLDLKPDYDKGLLVAACRIEVKNVANDTARVVPLLLYKMMTVHSVQGANRQELPFTQRNVYFDDVDSMAVNFVEVTLPYALAKNKTVTLDIRYDGYMQEYVETGMLYTQDRIARDFTILRPDCYAYPVIGYPNRAVNRQAGMESFDYVITVMVPKGLTAANGGRLMGVGTDNGRSVFTFQNIRPAWRMDVTIANYADLSRGNNHVYYFPEDAAGAERLLTAMEQCMELYTRWFGPLHQTSGFAVIEIPEGFGSQADVTSILQTADAFRDPAQLHQLYHELSHQWNVRETDKLPSRYNEGLATFLEWHAADILGNAPVFVSDQANGGMYYTISGLALQLRERLATDSQLTQVAPVDYGSKGIEQQSYSVGAVAFCVLWGIVGEEEFMRLLNGFYQEKEATGATAREFVSYLTRKSSVDLTAYANDWWLGTGWTERIKRGKSVRELAGEYKTN